MALKLYTVKVRKHETTMKLSDDAAQAMKDDGYELSESGTANDIERQDVAQPAHATDHDGNPLPVTDDGNRRVRSRQRTEQRSGTEVQTAARQPDDK